MEGRELMCPSCGGDPRAGARFCASCGVDLVLGGRPLAEASLAGAALAEAATATPGAGLGGPLAAYFACLAISATLILSHAHSFVAGRAGESAILVVGLVGLAATWAATAPLLGRPRLSPWRALALVAATAATFGAVQVVAHALPSLFYAPTLADYRADGRGPAEALLDVCVLPAVGEELVFRGVLLGGLLRVTTRRGAVIMSALLFATLHLSPLSMPHLTALGLILASARLRSKSLYPSMALHAAYNAAVLLSG